MNQQLVDAAVEAVKREILEDIEAGTVAETVPDFSALHSYVDANMYGGEAADALWNDDLDHEAAREQGIDPYAELNAMQTVVDDWLKAGGHRTAKNPRCVCHGDVAVIYRPRQSAWLDAATEDSRHTVTEGHTL